MPAFRLINFDDPQLAALQENVDRALKPLAEDPANSRRFLEDTGDGLKQGIRLLSASTVLVPHGLGRAVRSWKVVDLSADARVWRDATSTAPADTFLPLKCSANCTVRLEVW